MSEGRPDPDALLKAVQSREAHLSRGKLKVFFGANAGVGKTYAMLSEALAHLKAGCDVIAGIVETHGRSETAALLDGVPQLSLKEVNYRGVVMREFDLDAALKRRPALILVDELAHSNAPGSRHAKRWQDVEELLSAGIEVYTTVNVQHLESLNDVVARITGIVVRETVPDAILEQADEVELIDLPPEDVLERLREGKVYIPARAESAMRAFFTKTNLTALRELALRTTAQQVDVQLQAERTLTQDRAIWPAAERVIVCVSPSPHCPDLVRAARRLAAELRADWEGVYVETSASRDLSAAARRGLADTLGLVESLGGEAVTLSGEHVVDTIIAYARQHNVSKIVIGKPTRPHWLDRIRGSVVESLIRRSGDLDVFVVRDARTAGDRPKPALAMPTTHSDWREYALAVFAVAVATGIAWPVHPHLQPANLVMIYMLAVMLVALRAGRGPSVLAAVLAVGAFDFFFVPPYRTFAAADAEYLVTFAVMLAVSLVIASLTFGLREQLGGAFSRERRATSLYRLSRELAAAKSVSEITTIGESRIADLYRCAAAIVLRTGEGIELTFEPSHSHLFEKPRDELAVMQWVVANGKPAGVTTATLPGAEALYMPLSAGGSVLGVLAVKPGESEAESLATPEQRHLLETCAALIATALRREIPGQS